MKTQKIRTKVAQQRNGFSLGGWLGPGKNTYLRFAVNDKCVGSLGGKALYRLAKAIVRHYESGE